MTEEEKLWAEEQTKLEERKLRRRRQIKRDVIIWIVVLLGVFVDDADSGAGGGVKAAMKGE